MFNIIDNFQKLYRSDETNKFLFVPKRPAMDEI